MDECEKKYIGEIEKIIERFGTIQRNFILDKTGIRAIIKFIEDLEGRPPFFELDDPVVQKGKAAADKVIRELSTQLSALEALEAPKRWKEFHSSIVNSIRLQLEGYREMALVFEDSNMDHISYGQQMVNSGMKILEGGSRRS